MSIQQPIITLEQKTEITNYINNYRARHQSPPLTWDETIATFAQQWSFYLLSNNLFQHSGSALYGENLAYFEGYGNDIVILLKKAIDNWYNEITLYNFTNPGYKQGTGHFTCLVWKSSTKFGMGFSIDPSNNNKVDITFNSEPPGNYQGQFAQNVLAPTGTTPLPLPTPTPSPTPSPIPIPTPAQSNKKVIIVALYNIIYIIQSNQSKAKVISALYDLIKVVNNMAIV
jgi:hypothetical protein